MTEQHLKAANNVVSIMKSVKKLQDDIDKAVCDFEKSYANLIYTEDDLDVQSDKYSTKKMCRDFVEHLIKTTRNDTDTMICYLNGFLKEL